MKANDVKIMLLMMRKDNKASVAVQSFPHTNLENNSSLLIFKTCIPEQNNMFLYNFNYGRLFLS